MSANLEELADGVFAWLHAVEDRFTCNVGVIVEDDSLTLIDSSGVPTSYESLARELRRFDRPVQRIFLTHGHADHFAGVCHFAPRTVSCSTETAANLQEPLRIQAYQQLHPTIAAELQSLQAPTPTDVISESQTLGRLHLRLFAGHTTGDLAISIPDAGVTFAGDLCFFDQVPLGIGASFDSWIEALEQIKSTSDRIVPGHGPIGSRDNVENVQRYLLAVLEAARNQEPLQPGPWTNWYDPWASRIPQATHRINIEQARNVMQPPATLMQLIFGAASPAH